MYDAVTYLQSHGLDIGERLGEERALPFSATLDEPVRDGQDEGYEQRYFVPKIPLRDSRTTVA